MSKVIVVPIFWGTTWAQNQGDKITGMIAFYQGIGKSRYAATANEYHDATSLITYNTKIGYTIDPTRAKSGDRPGVILIEVCKVIAGLYKSKGFVPTIYHYFPVYTDLSSVMHSYCAYHTGGYCPGTPYANIPIQYAFFWQMDQFDPGCSVLARHALPLPVGSKSVPSPSPRTSASPRPSPGPLRSPSPSPSPSPSLRALALAPVPLQSPGLMAIADASAHELSEVRTNPWPFAGWYNKDGLENADLCKGVHGKVPVPIGTTSWWLQGLFSNHAYTNSIGMDSDAGFVLGCIDGTNEHVKK